MFITNSFQRYTSNCPRITKYISPYAGGGGRQRDKIPIKFLPKFLQDFPLIFCTFKQVVIINHTNAVRRIAQKSLINQLYDLLHLYFEPRFFWVKIIVACL